MIHAHYTAADRGSLRVTLEDGDQLGSMVGPIELGLPWPAEGNAEADALAALVEANAVTIGPFAEAAPVPVTISDRQFFQALAQAGSITQDEALAAVKTGTLPARVEAAVAGLPEDQQFPAQMLLSGATTFERGHPMVAQLGAALGYDDAALDALWTAAAAL